MVKPSATDPEAWIGVDFDGTLAHYETWTKWNEFGAPIKPMVDRVQTWILEGKEVRIFTARVGLDPYKKNECKKTGELFTNIMMASAIGDWCEQHVGRRIPVTCVKDYHMTELWDDRAVQVVANTGRTLAEEHEAVITALQGKAYVPE